MKIALPLLSLVTYGEYDSSYFYEEDLRIWHDPIFSNLTEFKEKYSNVDTSFEYERILKTPTGWNTGTSLPYCLPPELRTRDRVGLSKGFSSKPFIVRVGAWDYWDSVYLARSVYQIVLSELIGQPSVRVDANCAGFYASSVLSPRDDVSWNIGIQGCKGGDVEEPYMYDIELENWEYQERVEEGSLAPNMVFATWASYVAQGGVYIGPTDRLREILQQTGGVSGTYYKSHQYTSIFANATAKILDFPNPMPRYDPANVTTFSSSSADDTAGHNRTHKNSYTPWYGEAGKLRGLSLKVKVKSNSYDYGYYYYTVGLFTAYPYYSEYFKDNIRDFFMDQENGATIDKCIEAGCDDLVEGTADACMSLVCRRYYRCNVFGRFVPLQCYKAISTSGEKAGPRNIYDESHVDFEKCGVVVEIEPGAWPESGLMVVHVSD